MHRLERSHSNRYSTVHRSRCAKCYYYFRQVTTFLFSHIGLVTVLLGYVLIGAMTFQALELKNERLQRSNVLKRRLQAIEQLSQLTRQSLVLDPKKWKANATIILNSFEQDFYNSVRYKGFDDLVSDGSSKDVDQWTFTGSFLYSIIVITTIGYGNIAPRTDYGKIFTILYALIGIPLMLFFLSNIGFIMAHSFKFIYWKCCCYLCVKPKDHKRRLRRRRRLMRQRQRAMLAAQLNNCCGPMNNTAANSIAGGRFVDMNTVDVEHHHHQQQQQQNIHLLPLPSPNDRLKRSSSSYASSPTPILPQTPLMNNKQTIFFNQSPNEFDEQPKNNPSTNLGRSLSARYPGEKQKYQHSIVQRQGQSKNSSYLISRDAQTNDSGKNPLSPVICNRFASHSDECLPSRIAEEIRDPEPIFGKTKLTVQPRRTQSQVRFQRPTIINRRRHESDNIIDEIITEEPSQLKRQLSYYDPPTMTGEPTGTDSTLYYSEDQTPSVFGVGYAQPLPYSDFSDLESNDNDSELDDEEYTEKNIPITVCLLLVIGYICGGAVFFSVSEEWSFLDAAYFCFVTLSTIGFGDLVPGRTVKEAENMNVTLAICSLYLLFGMALLAMSLNLVKEKVVETVKTIGERIGLLVSDEDDEYY